MASTADLIARSSELKRELVRYAQQPRYERAFREALRAHSPESAVDDDRQRVMFMDYFALQHRFSNGRTVLEQFVAAHPELTDDDRAMMLGWRTVVEGIFEIQDRDADALLVKDLTDGQVYRVHSNSGPEVYERMPAGSFLITRLIPVGADWLISGATAVAPHTQRQRLYERAAELAARQAAAAGDTPAGAGDGAAEKHDGPARG